jgi:hypothetical protein
MFSVTRYQQKKDTNPLKFSLNLHLVHTTPMNPTLNTWKAG